MAATKKEKATAKNRIPQRRKGNGEMASGNGKAAPEKKPEEIVLFKLEPETISVPIKQLSPLIMHKFSDKARQAIEDKQAQRGKTTMRGKRDPESEYYAAMYTMPSGPAAGEEGFRIGIPACAIKNAIVSAARFVDGVTMASLRGALFVLPDEAGLVEMEYDEVIMREDAVRVGGKGKGTGALDLRYRPEFHNWRCVVRIDYNATVFSAEQILNLINIAGYAIGLLDYRPDKDGDAGRFMVDVERLGKV